MARRQIDPNNLPSNNQTAPNRREEPQAVARGNRKRKSGALRAFADLTNGLFEEIIKPALKGILVDAITTGATRAITGEPQSYDRRGGGRSHRSYHTMHRPTRRQAQPVEEEIFEDVFFRTWSEADQVLSKMTLYLNQYGTVLVSDYYAFSGISSPYSARSYGWMDLSRVGIENAGGNEYVIGLPEPEHIRR